MSADHKAALAQGRLESRVVREYLEALRNSKPKRGRKRSAETIQKRLAKIETELATADPLSELLLVQERRDLQDEFENLDSGPTSARRSSRLCRSPSPTASVATFLTPPGGKSASMLPC